MKKVLLIAAAAIALSASAIPSQAATVECMIFPLFAKGCTQPERIIFSALWGAGLGAGVGGVVGASVAGYSATNSAVAGLVIGGGVGAVAPVVIR